MSQLIKYLAEIAPLAEIKRPALRLMVEFKLFLSTSLLHFVDDSSLSRDECKTVIVDNVHEPLYILTSVGVIRW